MHIDVLHRLSTWLAATDIALLELRGPDTQLRLRHDGASVEAVEDELSSTPQAPDADAGWAVAKAMSVGVFLHRHPLHEGPLARPGARVRAGQTVGLLQVGALLLPVPAPKDSTLATVLVAHGQTVGFGTPLIELQVHIEDV